MNSRRPLSERVIAVRIDSRYAGKTVLQLLTGRFTYRDEAGWRECLQKGELCLEGQKALPDDLLQPGMTLEYRPETLQEPEADLHYSIVYEEPGFLVADKPGDLPVHPAGIFYAHTLWYLLTERYGAIYPVNRLDRETSGLLVVAKTPEYAAKLAESAMHKRYLALVFGKFRQEIDAKGTLVRDEASSVRRKRKFILNGTEGEFCRTLLAPEKIFESRTLVKAELFTGRMHQIRATLFSLGFPLVGDKLYGKDETFFIRRAKTGMLTEEDYRKLGMKRQALHAAELAFQHPETGKSLHFTSPLPSDFAGALRQAENGRNF